MDGLTATRELRKRGYTGRIVATTARTQPSDRQACLDAGCDDYIPKPHTRASLAQVLDTVHQELLFSTLARDPDMIDLVNTFVATLPARIRAMEEALAHDDLAKLEFHTRALKGEGAGYGFEILTQTAGGIEAALICKSPFDQIRTQVNDLVKLCLQVRSSAHLAGLTQNPDAQAAPMANPDTEPQPHADQQPQAEPEATSALENP
jgi:HPt (histidine-containing phosphotransfer) domain-containing protein